MRTLISTRLLSRCPSPLLSSPALRCCAPAAPRRAATAYSASAFASEWRRSRSLTRHGAARRGGGGRRVAARLALNSFHSIPFAANTFHLYSIRCLEAIALHNSRTVLYGYTYCTLQHMCMCLLQVEEATRLRLQNLQCAEHWSVCTSVLVLLSYHCM